jgi:ribosomal protein S25
MIQYKDTPYFVDTEGNVYRSGKKLKPSLVRGYYVVSLYPKKRSVKVHRIVAETFIPNPENKPEVNHINGIKTDNRVDNLEWNTSKENVEHKINILGKSRGEAIHTNILTEEQVKSIRKEHIKYSKIFGAVALSKKYNVSTSCIDDIVNYRSWKHLL